MNGDIRGLFDLENRHPAEQHDVGTRRERGPAANGVALIDQAEEAIEAVGMAKSGMPFIHSRITT